MSNILVASTNPNKLQGTKQAFETFPEILKEVGVKGEKVQKVVPALPIGFKQTLKGAKTRAEFLFNKYAQDYDFYVGLECGVYVIDNNNNQHQHAVALTVAYIIESKTTNRSFGVGPGLVLPTSFNRFLTKDDGLTEFANSISNIPNLRKKAGIPGLIFNNKVTRKQFNFLAVLLALGPFVNKEFYN